jgi:hypothetical protein
VFVQTCADLVVRQRLARRDLGEALLDLAYEPIVVVDQALDRCASQLLRVRAALLGNASLACSSADSVTSIGRVYGLRRESENCDVNCDVTSLQLPVSTQIDQLPA